MTVISPFHPTGAMGSGMSTDRAGSEWVGDLAAFLGRRWRTVAASCVVVLAVGVVYQVEATPKFTATSTMVIDTLAAASLQQQQPLTDSQFANGIVESQVEVLQSERVTRAVVRKLHLAHDPAFLLNGRSLMGSAIGSVTRLFSSPMPETPDGPEKAAAELLLKMMSVRRIGMSYVLELSVTSRSAVQSAHLANALVDAYVDVGLDAKNDNVRRAGAWLQQRLQELHDQAVATDSAVQSFKASANIIDTDKGLMNERHLGELNSQLVLARAHTADMRARYERAKAILQGNVLDGTVTDAMQNEAIIHLRKDYDDDARQASDWESRLGSNHAAVVGMRARMKDIETQLRAELERIAQGYLSDYKVALSSQQDIERQLDALATASSVTNANLVRLRALQSSANTYRSLYENFLQRYTQAVQDQSFPISEVQIVTRASPPLRKSHPKGIIVLGGAAMLGLAVGFALAFLRESLDGGLRMASEVRTALGVPCVGVLPAIKPRGTRNRTRREQGNAKAEDRIIRAMPPILRQAIVAPYTPFAETIRGLRVRLTKSRDRRRDIAVIGCLSALPGEGKTTVSANLATFLAQSGFRTLLVDLDLRRRSLSHILAPAASGGLVEVAGGRTPLASVLWRDPTSGLAFLPASGLAQRTEVLSDRLLASPHVSALLRDVRSDFDYVIVDLPAMLPVAEAGAAADWMDGLFMVVEWGRTRAEIVQEGIVTAELDMQRFLGVVLNKADPSALHGYGRIEYPSAGAISELTST